MTHCAAKPVIPDHKAFTKKPPSLRDAKRRGNLHDLVVSAQEGKCRNQEIAALRSQ